MKFSKSTKRTLQGISEQIRRLLTDPSTNNKNEAARLLIEARLNFFERNGEADIQGRSFAYRDWYGDILNSLNLSYEERLKIQNSLRYHTNQILRDELNIEELQELGLLTNKPTERRMNKHSRMTQALDLVEGKGRLTDEEFSTLIAVIPRLTNSQKASRVKAITT